MDAAQKVTATELHNKIDKLISVLITTFANIIRLSPTPPNATKEVAAQQALQVKTESGALVKAADDLLMVSRQLKELWLFGPLRGLGEGESSEQMDEDATVVERKVKEILEKVNAFREAEQVAVGSE